MRRPLSIGAVCAAIMIVVAAPADAVTTQIDFDDLPADTVLGSVSGVTFTGGPSVFNPSQPTVSEPHAVHTSGSCAPAGCTNNANQLEVRFDNPASSVSWRVGLSDEAGTAEFHTAAELIGYNAGGSPVASDQVDLGEGFKPITTELKADSSGVDIVRAVLTFGGPGTQKRVNADRLIFTDATEPVPGPPGIVISAPSSGAAFDRIDDIRVSGAVGAPAGVRRFCVTVTPTPPTEFPTRCEQASRVDPASSTFTALRTGPFVTGENHITAWVEDSRFRQARATVPVTINDTDLRVTNMEVTQGIQGALPVPVPEDNDVEHTADYNGVQLVQNKTTAVRVWTEARLDAAGTPIRGVAVQLRGFRADGTELPRGPLVPREGVRNLGPPLSFAGPIGLQTWSDPATSWTFLLPVEWTRERGPISLRAVVNPPAAFPRVNECEGCEPNNTLTLRGVGFAFTRGLDIWPFQAFYRRDGRVVKPNDRSAVEFRDAAAVSPFVLNVRPYQGTLNVQSIADDSSLDGAEASDALMGRLTDAIDTAGYPGFHTMALIKGLANGLNGDHFSWSSFTVRNYSVVNSDRPFTSVTHEMYHSIGFEHAGEGCAGAEEGGGADDWPPDDTGLLYGTGTDVRPLYTRNPLTVYGQVDGAGAPIMNFDFMSYCAPNNPDRNVWISVRNWQAAFVRLNFPFLPRKVRPAQTASGPTLAVNAAVFPGGGQINRVEPAGNQLTPPAGDGSLHIVVRDASGAVLTDLPVATQASHVDIGGTASPVQQLTAVVPAANAQSIELVRDGQVLATRSRSAATPAAAVRVPAAGTRVGSRGTLSVRWLAADPDGSQGLTSRIEYSADDGKTYRGVAAGLTGTSYSLPIHLLSRSSAARIRITVNDGWNVATAVSRRFRVAGPPPEVEILSPLAGTRIAADQTLNLEGSAFDDRSRILSGKSLRWFDGRRSLGTGPRISVSGLRPGSHTLRLVARDRSGRAGTASVKVRVLAVTPQFVSLSAPSTLSRTARTATVRVASSVAGTLELGKQRFNADRRNRRFKFRIKPGSKTLSLRLVLRSGGRSAAATLTIPRS